MFAHNEVCTVTGAPPTTGMPIGPPPTVMPADSMAGIPTGMYGGVGFGEKQPVGQPGTQGVPHPSGQFVGVSDVDMDIRINPAYMRSTVGLMPNTQAGGRTPLGVLIRPMALDSTDPDAIDVIDFGSTGIVRCKRCRFSTDAVIALDLMFIVGQNVHKSIRRMGRRWPTLAM